MSMRTTIRFDADVAAEIERQQAETGDGISKAVNDLIRAGLLQRGVRRPKYEHKPRSLGTKIDISNIGDVHEILDEA